MDKAAITVAIDALKAARKQATEAEDAVVALIPDDAIVHDVEYLNLGRQGEIVRERKLRHAWLIAITATPGRAREFALKCGLVEQAKD